MYKRKKNKGKKIITYLSILGITLLNLTPLFGVHKAGASMADTIEWMYETYEASGSPTSSRPTGLYNSTQAGGVAMSEINSKTAPSASIAFTSSSNIAPGVEITATANPAQFKDVSSSTLYFTWYIKREGCDLGSTSASCDEDGDGKVTVNDWKIVAARRIVKGDYDNTSADYTSAPASTDMGGGVDANPSVDDWEMTVDHSGIHNDSDVRDCYVQDPESRIIYELRETEPTFFECPSGYHPACVHNTTANCNVLNPDPAYRSSPFGPLSKTVENTFSACGVSTEDVGGDYGNITDCIIEDDAALKNFESYAICKGDPNDIPFCVSNSGFTNLYKAGSSTYVLGTIFGNGVIGSAGVNETNGVCSTLARENTYFWPYDPAPNFLENACITPDPVTNLPTVDFLPLASTGCSAASGVAANIITGLPVAKSMENCSTLIGGFITGLKLADGTAVADARTDLFENYNENWSTCAFDKGDNLCKHLFPYFPEDTISGMSNSLSGAKTGDGEFTMAEKEFWGANPTSDETNGTDLDEAAVMGLGKNTITWTYAEGDQIGFAVEGETSLTTDHPDGGNRIMWAFSNNTCSALEDIADDSGFYEDTTTKRGILATEVDLDDCLEENLVSPEADYNEIEVDLSSTPASPINDESGAGDRLTIVASVQNVNDLSSMYYDWEIGLSEDGAATPNDDTRWTDITDEVEVKSIMAADMEGLGKNKIELLLNLPASLVDPDDEGVFWLRAKVTATENSGTGSQTGTAKLNIKVIQQQKTIGMHTITADSAGKLILGPVDDSCLSGSMCYVVNDQIVGLKVDIGGSSPFTGNITWTVNNVGMTCTDKMSGACASKTDTLFFPILGNEGEAVNVTAKGVVNGEVVTIIKKFVIIVPQTIIGSRDMDNAWPKLLGFYKDFAGTKYPDFSSLLYNTHKGNTMTFKASTYSALNYARTYTWTLDGATMTGDSDSITIFVDKEVDDNYNLSVSAEMSSDASTTTAVNNIRKALLVNWGVVADDFIDAATDDSIQINVLDSSMTMNSEKTKTGIFASLATNLPEQLMFLLKIALTSFALVFAMGLLFAIIPDSLFDKKE